MKTAPPTRAWSLAQELGAIELAAEGCAAVVAQIYELPADERTAKVLASQAEAMLTLIHLRLRDLGRVLRGELDPVMLAGQHNVVPVGETLTNPGEDVVFAPRASPSAIHRARRR